MELINATRMVAGFTMGMEPSGRELLVVVVKGTFRIPARGEQVRLDEVQLPLVMADTFTGAAGLSAPVHESDFSPRKARCDVLLRGSAHAPGGRPTTRVPVGLRVGDLAKSFVVVGARYWDAGPPGIGVTPATPFVVQDISYDVAFGGTDQEHDDPLKHAAFLPNPVGRGFRRHLRAEWVDGKRLPNTEELYRPVSKPDEAYRPMAFGPLGRGWEPRLFYAGTYDDHWREACFPFLPPDFDEQYYQAAPLDQQLSVPNAEISVVLMNLTPDGERSFSLPYFPAPIHIFPKKGERENHQATLDTVEFDPDNGHFTMTWRLARPLKKDIFEIAQVLVGRKGRAWWQQQEEVVFPLEVVTATLRRRPAPVAG